MRSTARLILTALFCFAMDAVAPEAALAQGGGATTSLSGTVTDTSGAIIPGATVVVKSIATATQFDAVTNESGYFSVPALDPGAYTVTVTLMGFKTAVLNDVRVNASTPATVKVALSVGGLEETVVVTGGSEMIQTTSAAVTSTIDANQILKIPTGSRSALEFVALLPGVSTPGGPGGTRDSTVNGLPQSAINITIDGMSAQDNHLKTGDGFFARVSPRLDAIEEVTVNSAAQDASSTGQGAVQIRFVTRSGSNQFTGSGYYYLQHYKLNANTWFNNRDNAPKADDVLHQPGGRIGGPVIIPGVWNGRNKAFFFFNYEESRAPGANTENRTLLHPRSEQGWFRYTAGGVTREVNVLSLAATNGFVSTIDPTIGRVLSDIRASTTGSTVVDNTDPLTQNLTYWYQTDSVTKYPTGRLDVNLTDKHRLSWSMTYTDLVSTPDTTNNREPNFPGFPNTGSQVSDRYITRGTLRSTLGANLVNEVTIGGSGGPTMFAPEIAASQFSGTPVADQAGFLLNINTVGGITNAASTGSYQAREASTKVIEDTLSWLRGSHNIQAGGSWTRTDVWLQNQQYVPTMNFGIDGADPANGMFTTTNFSGASAAQLTEARDLFATLTGRVNSINGEQRLDENTDQYVFLGLGMQRARLVDYGFFVADTWRVKPTFTLNLGLRYDLQLPFYPRNNSYSKATVADVWGRSGVGNLFSPGGMTGQSPSFTQYDEGEGAYDTDLNNWAPNVGFAWTLGGSGGFLKTLLGSESGDSVLRAGYSMGYNRPGTSDFTGAIAANPGVSLSANRSAALGNLGTPGSIFLRNRADVGPPANMPVSRVYPMSDVITGDITVFEPGHQVPYAMTWTGGWQRKVGSSMVVEARYVGSRSLQSWQTYNYNEINIVENNFLNEFRVAQRNLESNIAAGRGNTFAYTGAAGTAPLPIFLAHFNAAPASASGDTARYTGTNWTNTTFLGYLAKYNPTPYNFANTGTDRLIGNATFRGNALTAGLPANFFQVNPDLIGGANIVGNGGATYYNSLQLEFRKRLSDGLQFQSNYVFAQQDGTQRFSLRYPRERVQDTGTEGEVTHAFRANWVYELPFGQGRRFGSGAGPWMNRLIGGWSLDGIARIQSGTTLDFGNVRLVGMSQQELQDSFKLRFDDAGKLIYMLPQDIIDNTVRAFSTSGTSTTGYSDQGVPEGRYMAPANSPDCIEIATGQGDCGVRSLVVVGPTLFRFDLSTSKRIAIKGTTNFEFRAEFLNAFNTPWFEAVATASNNPNNYRVTDADSGRTIQFVFRVNF